MIKKVVGILITVAVFIVLLSFLVFRTYGQEQSKASGCFSTDAKGNLVSGDCPTPPMFPRNPVAPNDRVITTTGVTCVDIKGQAVPCDQGSKNVIQSDCVDLKDTGRNTCDEKMAHRSAPPNETKIGKGKELRSIVPATSDQAHLSISVRDKMFLVLPMSDRSVERVPTNLYFEDLSHTRFVFIIGGHRIEEDGKHLADMALEEYKARMAK